MDVWEKLVSFVASKRYLYEYAITNSNIMNLKDYIKKVSDLYKTGQSTEHSFRPALADYIQDIVGNKFRVINERQRIDCGAPDLTVNKGDSEPVFFIEAKMIGDNDLDGRLPKVNKSQFDRYKAALEHIVFTDYLDFHFYENETLVDSIRIGNVNGNKVEICKDTGEHFKSRIINWSQAKPQKIKSASQLAKVMANKAKLLYNITSNVMQSMSDNPENYNDRKLEQLYDSFKKDLIQDLSTDDFSDMYAQTIVYGLFSARLNDKTPEDFSLNEALNLIPKSNPFLRQVFNTVAGADLDDRVSWVVDDLTQTFAVTEVDKVMKDYGKNTKDNDPMVHFYEDFLTVYNAELRKDRGVWYTPKPVVNFIIKSVDEILQKDFGLADGLADISTVEVDVPVEQSRDGRTKDGQKHEKKTYHKVQILDVATGTGTFPAEVIRVLHDKVCENNAGGWQQYVDKHLKPRLNGFEIMMAPYTIAHLKLDMVLRELDYVPHDDKRLNIYLADSLVEYSKKPRDLFNFIAEEANKADKVKRDLPLMVLIGNPPYNGSSQNKGKWIMSLIDDYKKEPGGKVKLDEGNPKWLNDDYVKFIRMAQHYVSLRSRGVIGYINAHGYLDNVTFRGMRWNLLRMFDKIYVLNLHGNAKKGLVCPDGSKDENVFPIQQGVCINLFVKTGKKATDEMAKVYYADLWGRKKDKLDFLSNNSMGTVKLQEIPLHSPWNFFVPFDYTGIDKYMEGISMPKLFPINSVGVLTTKDAFLVCDTKDEVRQRVSDLIRLEDRDVRTNYRLKDTDDWSLQGAKNDVGKHIDDSKIITYDYRPFDKRYIYYTGKTKGIIARPRYEVQRNMLKPNNLALLTCRQGIDDNWNLVGVSEHVVDDCRLSNRSKERGYVFPLYVYLPDNGKETPYKNFDDKIYKKICDGLGYGPTPEQVFCYIYAVLNSPKYRAEYQEFLKIDFPRVPYPTEKESFEKLAEFGRELVELHLMRNPSSWKLDVGFPVGGSDVIEEIRREDGKVFINSKQYFSNVPESAWSMFMGGYQPAQKWLKDHKGKTIDYVHYERIIYVLDQTASIMAEIDNYIVNVPYFIFLNNWQK